MKRLVPLFLLAFLCNLAFGQEPRKGYVLKFGEGEVIDEEDLFILLATPESGTQGSVFVYDAMPKGSTSGLHYHLTADEFFYVLEGRGTVQIGTENHTIEPHDMIFVPVGTDHKITSSVDDPLRVIFILDRPGFDEQVRLHLDRSKMTLEEFNAIVEKHGTIYKSFE